MNLVFRGLSLQEGMSVIFGEQIVMECVPGGKRNTNRESGVRWAGGQQACPLPAGHNQESCPGCFSPHWLIFSLLASLPVCPHLLPEGAAFDKDHRPFVVHVQKQGRGDVCVSQWHLALEDQVRWIILFVLKSITP